MIEVVEKSSGRHRKQLLSLLMSLFFSTLIQPGWTVLRSTTLLDEAMLLWSLWSAMVLLTPLEAADEEDVRAGRGDNNTALNKVCHG